MCNDPKNELVKLEPHMWFWSWELDEMMRNDRDVRKLVIW